MMMHLVLSISLVGGMPSPSGEGLLGEARFLRRGDLPEEFQFPLLELDFAVLRVRITNDGAETWTLKAQDLVVRDPKGKQLARVSPPEITPRIINSKQFRRSVSRPVHGQATHGPPGSIYGPYSRRNPIPDVAVGPRVISVDTGKRIRSVLEAHEVKDTTLAPGEILEALVYFKSKKPPSKLIGSTLLVGKQLRVEILNSKF